MSITADPIYNGICVGGPWNDRGLTWGRDVKLLLASNNDGHAGEYRFSHVTNRWLWHPEGKEQPVSRTAEEQIDMQIREGGKTAPGSRPKSSTSASAR